MTDKPAALVTGAARRLGRAIALALAAVGHPVAVHSRHPDPDAEALADQIRQAGGRAAAIVADLMDEAETASLVQRAAATLGPVGVLVNNASVFERDEWDTVDRQTWDAHLQPNLRAPFVLM